MMEHDRISNRIAIALVLLGVVLTSASVGTFAQVGAQPQPDAIQTPGSFADDGAQFAFPINNVTFALSQDMDPYALGQDMDPYSLGQDMDPYAVGQDMDPY